MSWSARQYTSFEAERTRPVRDLLNGVHTESVRRAVDLGCGPGNSTEVLAARFPDAEVSGLDSSADMIEAARKRLPGVRFDLASILEWDDPGPFDLILANPPYVEDAADLAPDVREHEPAGALFAGADGLDDYRVLIPQLPGLLAAGGVALVEIGHAQASAVTAIAHAAGLDARLHRDLADRARVLQLWREG